MKPNDFLEQVVQANMEAALEAPDDMRSIVNAILTLDALAGALHADGKASGRPEIAAHARDDDYREMLAHVSPSFRVLRDAAAALKHGELTDPRKRGLPRLVRTGGNMRAASNGLGSFRIGDPLNGTVIVVEFSPGPARVRASNVIADSYRMLARIVRGGTAGQDEHDDPMFANYANRGPAA